MPPALAAVGIAVVLCVGVLAIVVTRRAPEPEAAATTTTEEQTTATVPTPEDIEDLRAIVWRAELGGSVGHRVAVSDDLTLATVDGVQLVAVDRAGSQVWRTRLATTGGQASFGVVVGGGVALTRSVGGRDDILEAHRAADGEPLWRTSVPTAGYVDPQIRIVGDRAVVNAYDQIIAYDIQTGDEIWAAPGSGGFNGLVATGDEILSVDSDLGRSTWLVALDAETGAERRRVALDVARLDTRWPLLADAEDAAVTVEQGEWARTFQPVATTATASPPAPITLDLDLQGVPLMVVDGLLLVATSETYTLVAFSLETGAMRWASSHTVFEVSDLDGRLVGRGLELIEIDPSDGGATVLARDLTQIGGPAVESGDLLIVPDETGLTAYR